MKTLLTKDANEAAEFIKHGGIVAFPTETVYGLGANVFDESAVARIFNAKRRPADNPLIAHIATLDQLGDLALSVSGDARKLIDAFFPGPLTVILPKTERVPTIATAGLDTTGIRMPNFELARRFLKACGTPVVAPSANLSGRPSPTTWQAVAEDLDGRIDCILQGDPTEIGLESTVVDCSGDAPILLRAGAISLEQIRAIVAETVALNLETLDAPKSPGLKHRHYSPNASVVLIDKGKPIKSRTGVAAYIGLSDRQGQFEIKLFCGSLGNYAHSVFEFFRECDRRHVETIYCEKVDEIGVGTALMDRLRRAAEIN